MYVVRFGTTSQLQLPGERNLYRADAILAVSFMLDGLYTRAVLGHCKSKVTYKGAVGQTSVTQVDVLPEQYRLT